MNDEKGNSYFIFGICDSRLQEINYKSYSRIKLPISKLKISDGDFNSIKLTGNFTFCFGEFINDLGGYIIFGKDEIFGRKARNSIALFPGDSVTINIDITFHDKEAMKEFTYED